MQKLFLIVGMLLFFAVNSAHAYRPFSTEDAGVAGKGVLQTEISYDYFKWKNGDNDQVFLLVSPIYGPTEYIELSIETPFIFHNTQNSHSEGVGDINLVGKYVLFWDNYEKKDALLTLKGVVKLNNGDFNKGIGRGDMEYSLFPVLSKNIGDFMTVNTQAGYTFISNKKDANFDDYYFYGAALDFAVTKPFHFVTEINGNKNLDRRQDNQVLALFGFTYEISKQLTVDATYKKGLTNSSPDWGFGVGAAIEF